MSNAIEMKLSAVGLKVEEFSGSQVFGGIAKLIIDNKEHAVITSWEASDKRAAISATITVPAGAPIRVDFEQKPEKR